MISSARSSEWRQKRENPNPPFHLHWRNKRKSFEIVGIFRKTGEMWITSENDLFIRILFNPPTQQFLTISVDLKDFFKNLFRLNHFYILNSAREYRIRVKVFRKFESISQRSLILMAYCGRIVNLIELRPKDFW